MDGITFDGTAITIVLGLLGSLIATVVAAFKIIYNQMIKSRDQERQTLLDQIAVQKEMMMNAIYVAKRANNERRASIGEPALDVLADVVPEHNSPTTEEQKRIADLATARAAITALNLDLGIPPRVEAEEEERQAERQAQNKEVIDQIEILKENVQQTNINQEKLQALTTEVDETADEIDRTTRRIEEKQDSDSEILIDPPKTKD